MIKRKEKELTFEELMEYFEKEIPNEQLNLNYIDLDTLKIFKELICNNLKQNKNSDVLSLIEIDRGSDD